MTTLPPDAEEYLGSLRSERGLSLNTVSAYRRDLADYFAFCHERGAPDDAGEFMANLAHRRLARSTRARKLAAVRGYHRFLVVEGRSVQDPTALIDPPRRGEPLPKALTLNQVERLIDAPDRATPLGVRDVAIIEFLYGTGARASETIAVGLTALDLESGTVLVTGKGDRQRLIPLGRHARAAIETYLPIRLDLLSDRERSDVLFVNARGKALSRQGIWDIVKRNGRRAGIEEASLSPHVLRHSTATHMVEGGADLRSVRKCSATLVSVRHRYIRVCPPNTSKRCTLWHTHAPGRDAEEDRFIHDRDDRYRSRESDPRRGTCEGRASAQGPRRR